MMVVRLKGMERAVESKGAPRLRLFYFIFFFFLNHYGRFVLHPALQHMLDDSIMAQKRRDRRTPL